MKSAGSRHLRKVLVASSLPLLGALGASARADVPVEPERLPAFARSVAGTDDTTAIVQNPANLGFLPGAEFRWEGVYLNESLRAPYQGHALAFGFRLPFGFGTGLRLDLVDPPTSAFGGHSDNYQWLTWGLAVAPSEALAFGFSLQRAYSDGPVADSLGSYSLAVTARPTSLLGLSFVAHHVNGPLTGDTAARLASLGATNVELGPSTTPALAIRPFGTRALEVGLEARYLFEPQMWEPRATLGVDVPYVGRLRGEFLLQDPEQKRPEWRAAASISFYLNAFSGSTDVQVGGITGTALGQKGTYDLWNEIAVRSFGEPVGVFPPRNAARLRIESTPDARKHVALLRKLWSLSEADDVVSVVFELRDSPADSLAHAQELRDAIALLRARGKRVMCHLEDASGAALYVCAAADRILVNPAGGIRFAGLKTRHFYIAQLLENIGVQADFVRVGAHKSAPEQFTRTGASDVARADTTDLLQQNELWFMGDIARDRHIPVEALRERIARGPFMADEARDAGLVDGFAFDDQIEAEACRLSGEKVPLVDADRADVAPTHFGKEPSIALVYIDGDIIDGRSRTVPFLGIDLVGSYTIAETLRRIRENPAVRSVVLRVESPGGSSMASDVMWREVALTAKVKPVVVSMGGIAASGGYYVAAPGTRVFANPLTVTGSIGVFYGKADVSGLLRKIGVNVEVYKTGPRADAESMFRPFTPEERRELERKVGKFYDIFLSRVADGRHLAKSAVDAAGQGRVWTGEQAKQHGLVDELGGLRQALAEARRLSGLPEDAPIVELPKIQTSILGQILGIEGIRSEAIASVLPPSILSAARAMTPFLVHPPDRPLARVEVAPVEP